MKRRCEWCGSGFEWEGMGRPPKFCRRSHRQRAFEARREASRLGIGGVLLADEGWGRFLDAAYVLETAVADAEADLADSDALGAAEGLLAAARAVLGSVPEPVASSG